MLCKEQPSGEVETGEPRRCSEFGRHLVTFDCLPLCLCRHLPNLLSENTAHGGVCFQKKHCTPQPVELTSNTDIPKKHTQSHTQDKSSETHACKHREFMQTGHFVFVVLHFQDQEHKTQETKRR